MTNVRGGVLKGAQFIVPGGAAWGSMEAFDSGHLFLGYVLGSLVTVWVVGQIVAMAIVMKADLRRLFRS